MLPVKTRDDDRGRRGFAFAHRAERQYASQLRKIAAHIGELVKMNFSGGEPEAERRIGESLDRYSLAIAPWARASAQRMLEDVNRRDEQSWADAAKAISSALKSEIATAPTGEAMRALLEQQVNLITGLPAEALLRIQKLTLEAQLDGTRAREVAEQIMASGEVSRSRANLIARTSVTTAASTLTQARAVHIGSDGYIWRTAEDGDVRPSHKKMAGRFVAWSSPPTLDKLTGHAGCLPYCRCYPEPLIPE